MIKFLAIVILIGAAIADRIPNFLPRAGYPEGRIIGGKNTTIEEAPYQVSISVQQNHYCGGSIIDKDWILTAAHCATLSAKYYSIRAGSSHSHIGGSIHKVSRVVLHKKYVVDSSGIPSNDIALFRLATPIVMDKTRQTIELYKVDEETKVGVYANITGWGTTNTPSRNTPHMLQIVSIPIISKADCKNAYKNLTILNPGQICAAYPNGGKDACQGDSGGPLTINGRLAGVVSWGIGCAAPRFPGAYTEVAYFRPWITQVMKTWGQPSSSTSSSSSSSVLAFSLSLGSLTMTTIVCKALTSEMFSF